MLRKSFLNLSHIQIILHKQKQHASKLDSTLDRNTHTYKKNAPHSPTYLHTYVHVCMYVVYSLLLLFCCLSAQSRLAKRDVKCGEKVGLRSWLRT